MITRPVGLDFSLVVVAGSTPMATGPSPIKSRQLGGKSLMDARQRFSAPRSIARFRDRSERAHMPPRVAMRA